MKRLISKELTHFHHKIRKIHPELGFSPYNPEWINQSGTIIFGNCHYINKSTFMSIIRLSFWNIFFSFNAVINCKKKKLVKMLNCFALLLYYVPQKNNLWYIILYTNVIDNDRFGHYLWSICQCSGNRFIKYVVRVYYTQYCRCRHLYET